MTATLLAIKMHKAVPHLQPWYTLARFENCSAHPGFLLPASRSGHRGRVHPSFQMRAARSRRLEADRDAGHLHRPQSIGHDHVRYSGAPLAFGFDEEGQEKSVSLIDLAPDGSVDVTEIPIKPLRQLRSIRGKLLELLAATEVSHDLVRVVLTDETPQIDPMKRIREFYPNAVKLAYERNERPVAQRLEEQRAAIDDPQTLASTFLEFVRGDALSETETGIVASALHAVETTEEGQ